MILTITEISKENQALSFVKIVNKARFRRRSTHVPNLTDKLSTAKRAASESIWYGSFSLVWQKH